MRRLARPPRPARPARRTAGGGRRTRFRRRRTSPPEEEAGDHVGEPVDVEQHAARRDGDRDADCETCEQAPGDVSPPAAEQERSARIERRCCCRVAARKRGTEPGGRRVEGRSGPVGEILTAVREDLLSAEQHEQERDDPCASGANRLGDCEHDGEDDHRPGDRAQLRDEHRARASRRPLRERFPSGDAPVERGSGGRSSARGRRARRARGRPRSSGAAPASTRVPWRRSRRASCTSVRRNRECAAADSPTLRAAVNAGADDPADSRGYRQAARPDPRPALTATRTRRRSGMCDGWDYPGG